ncbi:hypothetical protein Snoj_01010 [Streptomyces nojiriensis]|uniref:Uncharacterized protein n=1 Tax=Streptomyces nojiriensis TaxID=66374 RepID=A0ABQ3SDH3_9ACTN|nr:hypothetical protein [Streptomyces nojiriensis]QTI42322.1 hypothetical protein JYK04_00079 [Streptomyces nojiriensis]GGS34465.1 hypothetical protein GCM10010205_75780 [Streptomyces nojiriensis]GHI66183.1 hypothetical protein Snoj_01010 [Streptomyces nojiriensis]
MPANTPQPQPQPQAEPEAPAQRPPAGNPGADPLVLLLLALVVLVLLGGVGYAVAAHPNLTKPVMAVAAVAAPLTAALIAVFLRRR